MITQLLLLTRSQILVSPLSYHNSLRTGYFTPNILADKENILGPFKQRMERALEVAAHKQESPGDVRQPNIADPASEEVRAMAQIT